MIDAKDIVAPDRIVGLQGGQNFREVGGYPTVDGKRLRRGLLWRSARLDALTADDRMIIGSLGIAAIADLRRPGERARAPTSAALLDGVRCLAWDADPPDEGQGPRALFQAGAEPDRYFAAILDLYRAIPEDHAGQLRDLYAAIADGVLPMLVHCAAGKDRTGVAIALLLDIVGIERACVLADYAKTEQLLDWDRLTASAAGGVGVQEDWLDRLDPHALRMLFRSDQRYLQAMFDDLAARYGSIAGFAAARLGVDAAMIEQLRARLIEP